MTHTGSRPLGNGMSSHSGHRPFPVSDVHSVSWLFGKRRPSLLSAFSRYLLASTSKVSGVFGRRKAPISIVASFGVPRARMLGHAQDIAPLFQNRRCHPTCHSSIENAGDHLQRRAHTLVSSVETYFASLKAASSKSAATAGTCL